MSHKELDRKNVLDRIKRRELSNSEAAVTLGLCLRQIKRLRKRYFAGGTRELVHKGRGVIRGSKRSPAEIERIKEILSTKLQGWPPQHTSEMLAKDGIVISRQQLRKFMIQWGFWKERQQKHKSPHVWREPKHHKGEMVQLDGSKHMWFGDNYSTLIAYIDDATRRINLHFAQEEDLQGVVHLTRQYLFEHGRPVSVYTDKGKVFKVNTGATKNITQFGRMLQSLDIKLIYAHSPQAKGRIERLFGTLQPRLVRELKNAGITTIESANAFLSEFVIRFNAQFSVSPQKEADMHRSIDNFNLNLIFARHTQRVLQNDFTISYNTQLLQLNTKNTVKLKVGDKITIIESLDKTIVLIAQEKRLLFIKISNYIKPIKEPAKIKERRPCKPAYNHPWRSYQRVLKNDKG